MAVFLRRTKFRTLNATPLKYKLFDNSTNAPHEIDPADLAPTVEPARSQEGSAA
jgi:hypothetical protein